MLFLPHNMCTPDDTDLQDTITLRDVHAPSLRAIIPKLHEYVTCSYLPIYPFMMTLFTMTLVHYGMFLPLYMPIPDDPFHHDMYTL